MEPTFSLLRLPENVIIKVLENLSLRQLFEFSLISTKTKNLMASLGLGADYVDIQICRMIRLDVYFGGYLFNLTIYNDSNDENGELPADITLPVAATFGYLYTNVQLTTPLLNFNKWLDHIRTVFCCTPPANIRFYRGSERFDIGSLKETIGNVNWLYVFGQSTDIHYKHILKYFNTPNKLFLDRNPFEIASEIQQFFIQNYETVRFHGVNSLDDMLLVNSEKVRFTHSISQKQFNQFIKHWIRGSNPRLQSMYLSIDKTDFVSGIVYLNGVRFMEMSEDAKTEIRQNHRLTSLDMVQIKRKDGTSAVIATYDGDHRLHINLIVLH